MTDSLRILIADDDQELSALLSEYLQSEGFDVIMAHDGEAALHRAQHDACDLMVLDIMMPKMNGMEVLKELRKQSLLPVVMLTARGEPVDRIVGLEIGADDYLPKPCNPRELVARIRAVLRRVSLPPDLASRDTDHAIEVDGIKLTAQTRTVQKQGEAVDLTSTEFDLLLQLLANAGQVVTKEQLSEQVLGRRLALYDRSIDMHVSHLRRKLGTLADGSERIKTVRGTGYIYVKTPVKSSA
ncbi:MAG: response regulator [Mariprofundaceae bacterium]|nr:response regulator [Mariprofundaceae bacterium]